MKDVSERERRNLTFASTTAAPKSSTVASPPGEILTLTGPSAPRRDGRRLQLNWSIEAVRPDVRNAGNRLPCGVTPAAKRQFRGVN